MFEVYQKRLKELTILLLSFIKYVNIDTSVYYIYKYH